MEILKETATHQKLDPNFEILLFYKYVNLTDPKVVFKEQKKIWQSLGLTGRMLIAGEGINATLEGSRENTAKYMEIMNADVRFQNIHWKKSIGTGNAFPRASIKARKEVVTLGLPKDFSPLEMTGQRLAPEELHKWFAEGRKFTILDMRNDYEHRAGAFVGSVCPAMKNFRDLPKSVQEELNQYREETIVTVCTGGIRCEKASGYLVREGFKDVWQLDGGIVSYMAKFPNENFKGKLYVFDGRVLMGYNTDNAKHEIISTCDKCSTKSENFINCKNPWCNKHFIACQSCSPTEDKIYCPDCESWLHRISTILKRKYFRNLKRI